MSRLRRLDEKRKVPKRMPLPEREQVMHTISGMLRNHREVVLAVAHGGFIRFDLFRDVDIAVFTNYQVSYDDEPYYVDSLRDELEKKVGLPVDVQLLDYAPPIFRIKALNGLLLFERISGLRAILKFHSIEEYSSITYYKNKHRISSR